MGKRVTKQSKSLNGRRKVVSLKQCVYISCRNKLLKKHSSLSNISGSKAWRAWQDAKNVRALEITCQCYQRRMNNNARKEKGHTPCHKNKRRILILYIKSSWGTQSKPNWNERKHTDYSSLLLLKLCRKLEESMWGFFLSHNLNIFKGREVVIHK